MKSYINESIVLQTQELMATQEKLSHAETQCQCLKIEKDMLKSIEQRLLQEKESFYKDQRSRDLLMSNLQSIQVIASVM